MTSRSSGSSPAGRRPARSPIANAAFRPPPFGTPSTVARRHRRVGPCHAMPCHAMPCHAMPVVLLRLSALTRECTACPLPQQSMGPPRPTAAAAHAVVTAFDHSNAQLVHCGIAHSAVPEWWIPNPFLRRGSSRFTCRRPSFLACAVPAQMCGRGEPGPSTAVGGAWPPPRRAPTAQCATAPPAALARRP
jgi:hypothetical protein